MEQRRASLLDLGLDSHLKLELLLFLMDSGVVDSAQSIARWTGHPAGEVETALSQMAEKGVITRGRRGNLVVYSGEAAPHMKQTTSDFLAYYRETRSLTEEELHRLQSERADIADRLNHLELSLEAIVSAMGEGLMVTDSGGGLRMANPVARSWFGLPDSGYGGTPVSSLKMPRELLDETLSSSVKESRSPLQWEVSPSGPKEGDPPLLSLQASVQKIFTDSGDFLGSVIVLSDVTRLKEIERTKDDILSFVSHELKTPLTNIKGYAETLLRQPQIEEKERDGILGIISSQADQMNATADAFLDLVRLDSGVPLNVRKEILALDELASKILETYSPLFADHELQVAVPKGAQISGDPRILGELLLNLLSNAAKYSPPHSKITLSADQDEQFTRIHVQDEGAGISEEELSNLFNRFARGASVGPHGTGIGLYLCKRLAESHGGSISVISTPDKGSTFTISIPK